MQSPARALQPEVLHVDTQDLQLQAVTATPDGRLYLLSDVDQVLEFRPECTPALRPLVAKPERGLVSPGRSFRSIIWSPREDALLVEEMLPWRITAVTTEGEIRRLRLPRMPHGPRFRFAGAANDCDGTMCFFFSRSRQRKEGIWIVYPTGEQSVWESSDRSFLFLPPQVIAFDDNGDVVLAGCHFSTSFGPEHGQGHMRVVLKRVCLQTQSPIWSVAEFEVEGAAGVKEMSVLDGEVDGAGNVLLLTYTAGEGERDVWTTVYMIRRDGTIELLVHDDPGTDECGRAFRPLAMTIDPEGRLVIVEDSDLAAVSSDEQISIRILRYPTSLRPPARLKRARLRDSLGSILAAATAGDLTLYVGQEIVSAHRAILAYRAPDLYSFVEKTEERATGKGDQAIEIDGIGADAFRGVLQFVYTDRLELCSGHVLPEVYVAAVRFDLPVLRRKTVDQWRKAVTDDNALELWKLAKACDATALERIVSARLCRGAQEVADEEMKATALRPLDAD
eukprot:scaffold1231_cov187-Pinguiococcus_pyrenoidosus.AAC.18